MASGHGRRRTKDERSPEGEGREQASQAKKQVVAYRIREGKQAGFDRWILEVCTRISRELRILTGYGPGKFVSRLYYQVAGGQPPTCNAQRLGSCITIGVKASLVVGEARHGRARAAPASGCRGAVSRGITALGGGTTALEDEAGTRALRGHSKQTGLRRNVGRRYNVRHQELGS